MRFLLFPLLFLPQVLAIGQRPIVNFNASGPLLADQSSFVTINADKNDWPAVLRVCDDLAMDFGRVTGTNGSVILLGNGSSAKNASMIFNVTGRSDFGVVSNATTPGGTIIVGTVGQSSAIDTLVSQGKINVSGIQGSWESYTSTMVYSPMPGVSEALVIAGSFVNIRYIEALLMDGPQAPIAEGPYTVCTASPSRLGSLLGTIWPIRLSKSTPRFTPTM